MDTPSKAKDGHLAGGMYTFWVRRGGSCCTYNTQESTHKHTMFSNNIEQGSHRVSSQGRGDKRRGREERNGE